MSDRIETELHEAYWKLQPQIRLAEQAISDARSVIYQFLGTTDPETAVKAANSWLDCNGRDTKREIILKNKND